MIIFSQFLCVWDWTNETERPLWSIEIDPNYGFQVSFPLTSKYHLTEANEIFAGSKVQISGLFFRRASLIIQTIALSSSAAVKVMCYITPQ